MGKGNRNPPKDTKFKKGCSGNPKGRPKGVVQKISMGSQFRKVAKEQITIEINGVRRRISRWDAYVRQIYNMALSNNSGTARLLDQLRRQFPGDLLPGETVTFVISEDDAML